MLITNLIFVFSSDLRAVLGGVQGVTFWVYEIPYDIGYDSFRSQRELPEYTKITPHCSEKSATFMESKIFSFFFAPKRYLSQGKTSKKNLCTTARQGLSESLSNDLTWSSVRKKMGGQKIHFLRFWVF
jgi:hypothetical protein